MFGTYLPGDGDTCGRCHKRTRGTLNCRRRDLRILFRVRLSKPLLPGIGLAPRCSDSSIQSAWWQIVQIWRFKLWREIRNRFLKNSYHGIRAVPFNATRNIGWVVSGPRVVHHQAREGFKPRNTWKLLRFLFEFRFELRKIALTINITNAVVVDETVGIHEWIRFIFYALRALRSICHLQNYNCKFFVVVLFVLVYYLIYNYCKYTWLKNLFQFLSVYYLIFKK